MDIFDRIFYALEIIGTIAFSISGASTAASCGLDYFGIIVLAITTAVGGGAIRDVMLGITPPSMFTNSSYFIVALVSAIALIIFYRSFSDMVKSQKIRKMKIIVDYADALGLGIFTIVGMNTAINSGHDGMFLTVFVGVLTGVGGGMIRDIFVQRTPAILVKDLYAISALIGGISYKILKEQSTLSAPFSMIIGIVIIIAMRVFALKNSLNLPSIKHPNS